MSRRTRELLFDDQISDSAAGVLEQTSSVSADWVLRKSDLDPGVARIIESVIEAVAAGEGVSVGRVPDVVTTTTAASMLGISRPTLMKHIRDGRLPSHSVGTHTRLRRSDVVNFRRELRAERAIAIRDLMNFEDELGEPL